MPPSYCPILRGPCVQSECTFFNQADDVCLIRQAMIALVEVEDKVFDMQADVESLTMRP
jgi:hypothetical protein